MIERPIPNELCLSVLVSVVQRPGALAADHGPSRQMAPRLRWLRQAGLVRPDGPSPARWYPTPAGISEIDRRRLGLLRERSRQRRREALDRIRRAEALFEFADSIRVPAPSALCLPRGQQRMTFGELVALLGRSVGREGWSRPPRQRQPGRRYPR